VDNKLIGSVTATTAEEYEQVITKAREAFVQW